MIHNDITIAITGGIGSGKTVVSGILSAMGYLVYDCDSNARALMDDNDSIKRDIASCISPSVIVDSHIDRRKLAEIVFNDCNALNCLNNIVHSTVREHFLSFRTCHRGVIFFETAILIESGFDSLADIIWQVTAPHELRIERVMKRSGLTRAETEARMATQSSMLKDNCSQPVEDIVNDGVRSLLQQVTKLLQNL